MLNEKRYITPCACAVSDTAAIQAAIDEAHRTDMRTVVLFPKENGAAWELEAPVRLPNNVTLILEGAVIRARDIAFMNEAAQKPETRSLGGEQYGLHILGTHGAKLIGDREPQILLCNVREYTVRGLAFEGGAGIQLTHARQGKLQKLLFSGSLHGIRFEEGCINNLAMDIEADTQAEAVLWSAGDTTVWGRSPEICHSSLCRLLAKTGGAPAVAVRPGPVMVSNLFLRDITDHTDAQGTSVELGDGGEAELRDVSVRGVVSGRTAASITGQCDGIYLGNLQAPVIAPEATRVLWEQIPMAVELPQRGEQLEGPFITANDPACFADTDAETLQNAVNAAAKQGVSLVIPRYNARTGKLRWDIDRAICLPSDVTVVLLDAHLRQTDFSYTNLFVNEQPAKNIRIIGVGSATLDSGKPNGLKVKNANTLGFGPITDNATVRFTEVDGFTVRGLHMDQSRWYSLCCTGCTSGHVADIDLYAPPIFPDLGGIRLHSGCRDILVENITGLSGEDMILVEGSADAPVSHIHVRNIRANSSRCCSVNLISHCHDVVAETLIDSSLPEQKKQPWAAVRIGQAGGQVHNITVRDVIGRGNAVVELGGSSQNVRISNIHGFGSNGCAVQSIQPAEVTDFQMIGTSEKLCEAARKDCTHLRDYRISGVFFRCLQASRYMRGTATSIITDKKKFVGTVMKLCGVQAADFTAEHLLAERIGSGIKLTGEGAVTVTDFQYAQCGREEAQCGSGCTLTVNGQTVPVTEHTSL